MDYTNRIFRVFGTVPLPDAAAHELHQEQAAQLNQAAQTLTKLVHTQDLLKLKDELKALEAEITDTVADSAEAIQSTVSNLNAIIDYTISKI